MKFSEFAQKLKKFSSLNNAAFVEELVDNIRFKDFKLPQENTLSKILKGNSNFAGIAKNLNGNIDKEKFQEYLEDVFCDQVDYLIKEINIPGIDTNNWSEKITDLFESIINDENKLGITNINSKNVLSSIPNIVLDVNENDINTADENIKVTIGKTMKTLESVQTIKLPDELLPYYEVKYEYKNDKLDSNIVAKNKEAYEKYPPNSKILVDMSDLSEEERQKRINIDELAEEVNVKNYPILLGKTLKKEDFFGNIPSPFNKNSKDALFYLWPKPTDELPVRYFSFKIHNDFINLNFDHIKMIILGLHDKGTTVSNERIANYDILSFQMRKKDNGLIEFAYKYDVKDEYKQDVEAILKLYKWSVLRQDKNSVFSLSVDESQKIIMNQKNNRGVIFNKKDKRAVLNIIEYFNKLIYIQNTLGYKFKVSDQNFLKELVSIDIVYNYLRKKQKTYKCDLVFDFYDYIEDLPPQGKIIKDCELPLHQIKLFDEEIVLENTSVIIQEAKIYSKVEGKSKKNILATQKAIIISK